MLLFKLISLAYNYAYVVRTWLHLENKLINKVKVNYA